MECELSTSSINDTTDIATIYLLQRLSKSQMATFQDIKVNIVSGGCPLPFYNDPETEGSESADPNTRNYYIEAVNNAFFTIEFWVTDEWKLRSGNGLMFTFNFDGGPSFVMPMAVQALRNSGKVTANQVSGIPEYDVDTGEWYRAKFRFGRLHLRMCLTQFQKLS